MADIKMNLEETLELDTIIEKSTRATDPISVEEPSNFTEGTDFDLDGIQKHSGIFNPTKSGNYKLNINGQILTVEVIDTSIKPEKLIAEYKFEDASDNTVAVDEFGNNGTMSGMSYVSNSAVGDNAISMDTTSSQVKIPNSVLPIGDEIGVIFYINMDNTADGYGTNIRMVQNLSYDTNSYGFEIENTSNPDEWIYKQYGTAGNLKPRANLSDSNVEDSWGQVAFTYGQDSSGNWKQEFYVNASRKINKDTTSDYYTKPSSDIYLTGDGSFKGDFDQFKIYDKKLTQTEIQNEFDTGSIKG